MLEEIANRISEHQKSLNEIDSKINLYKERQGSYTSKLPHRFYNKSDTAVATLINYVVAVLNEDDKAEITISYQDSIKGLEDKKVQLTKQHDLDMLNFKSKFCSKDTQSSKLHSFWNFLTK